MNRRRKKSGNTSRKCNVIKLKGEQRFKGKRIVRKAAGASNKEKSTLWHCEVHWSPWELTDCQGNGSGEPPYNLVRNS